MFHAVIWQGKDRIYCPNLPRQNVHSQKPEAALQGWNNHSADVVMGIEAKGRIVQQLLGWNNQPDERNTGRSVNDNVRHSLAAPRFRSTVNFQQLPNQPPVPFTVPELQADRNLPGNFQTWNDGSRLVTSTPAELLGEDVILNTDSVLHDFRKLALDVRFDFADIFSFEQNTQRSFQNLIFENNV